MNEDKCELYPECADPPTCSVRWQGTRHYGFLCARHLAEQQAAGHVATVYPIAHLLKRQQAIIAKHERADALEAVYNANPTRENWLAYMQARHGNRLNRWL